jgi:hypothetical protein
MYVADIGTSWCKLNRGERQAEISICAAVMLVVVCNTCHFVAQFSLGQIADVLISQYDQTIGDSFLHMLHFRVRCITLKDRERAVNGQFMASGSLKQQRQ